MNLKSVKKYQRVIQKLLKFLWKVTAKSPKKLLVKLLENYEEITLGTRVIIKILFQNSY